MLSEAPTKTALWATGALSGIAGIGWKRIQVKTGGGYFPTLA